MEFKGRVIDPEKNIFMTFGIYIDHDKCIIKMITSKDDMVGECMERTVKSIIIDHKCYMKGNKFTYIDTKKNILCIGKKTFRLYRIP